MNIAVDIATLPAAAQKILDPKSPAPLRQMAARGIAPGLKPGEAISVIVLLSQSEDEALKTAAQATLDRLPAPLLNGALSGDLPAGVIDLLAPRYVTNAVVMEKMLALPSLASSTVADIAARASEAVAELVATNEERLLSYPAIIEKLYMNKATRMSTADRVLELAVRHKLELTGIPAYKEAAAAIVNELIVEPSPEPTPDDDLFSEVEKIAQASEIDPDAEDTHEVDETTGEENVVEKFLPLHAQIAQMSVSQRIRRAMLGNATERSLLIRDRNKLVAQAAIRSPSIQENEVTRIAASRNVTEDVLRIIANDRQWTASHQIKLNLIMNPRCPYVFAAKLVPFLREHELKALAKSKNVTGAIVKAAKQQLERKGVK